MTTLQVFVADYHSGSRQGLCPPEVELESIDGPSVYCANELQLALLDDFTRFWRWMGWLKEDLKAKLSVWELGDGADDNKYRKAGLISANKNDIIRAGVGVRKIPLEVADEYRMFRGTDAHSGEYAWLEEQTAQQLLNKGYPIVPNEKESMATWWWAAEEVEGVKIHAAHHPNTAGFLAWTRGSAPARCSASLRNWYWERGDEPPDIAVFGHVHYPGDSGRVEKPRVLYCPGWQPTTYYIHKKGRAGILAPVGGWWLVCENGYYTAEPELFHVRKEPIWSTTQQ